MDFNLSNFKQGISDTHITELINYTHSDPIIQKFTSDLKRFSSIESFNQWRTGARIYTLVSDDNKLLGLIWFRARSIPAEFSSDSVNLSDYGFTVAMRLYQEARGRGFLRPFLHSAMENFKKADEYRKSDKKGIWLITSEDNFQAQAAFEKFGFKKIQTKSGKLLMVL